MVLFLEGLFFSKVAPTEKCRPSVWSGSVPVGLDLLSMVVVDF